MRVGLIIYGSINTITGGYIYDQQLVAHLRSKGIVVKIFSQPKKGLFQLVKNNFSKKLVYQIKEFSPDILLEDGMNYLSLFILNKKIKKKAKCQIISIVHLLQSCVVTNPLKYVIRQFEKKYFKTVDGFIFNSAATASLVGKLMQLPASFLVAAPGKDRIKYQLRDGFNKDYNNRLAIIFVGNLSPNKGLHLLLHALKNIDPRLWRLSIIGNLDTDKKYSNTIMSCIKTFNLMNNIQIYGVLEADQLKTHLLSHHVLVVPSYYESYGIVYSEAMGAGLPVIASKTGGVPEVVKHEVNGLLIEPGDMLMIRAALHRFIVDRSLLKQMSIASLSAYQHLPSWQESLDSIYNFLKSR